MSEAGIFTKVFDNTKKRLNEMVENGELEKEDIEKLYFGTSSIKGVQTPMAYGNTNEIINQILWEEWRKLID